MFHATLIHLTYTPEIHMLILLDFYIFSSDFIIFTFGNSIPSLCTIWPLSISRVVHLQIQNCIFISLLKSLTVYTREWSSCTLFPWSFRSSIKSKWLILLLNSPNMYPAFISHIVTAIIVIILAIVLITNLIHFISFHFFFLFLLLLFFLLLCVTTCMCPPWIFFLLVFLLFNQNFMN